MKKTYRDKVVLFNQSGIIQSLDTEALAKFFGKESFIQTFAPHKFSADEGYDPSLKPENYIPKPSDYVRVPFRMLSATIVAGGTWRAVDFSRAGVLKSARKLLEGIPALKDHSWSVDDSIGVVESAKWTEAQMNSDGVQIPAGLDGVYKIDAASNPKLVRSLLSDPPAVQGSSVSVEFEWEPSHVFLDRDGNPDEWEFRYRVGMIIKNADGTEEMVRRIATKIIAFYESSIVTIPADDTAKIIRDGVPYKVNQAFSDNASFSAEIPEIQDLYEKKGFYFAQTNTPLIKLSTENFSAQPTEDVIEEAEPIVPKQFEIEKLGGSMKPKTEEPKAPNTEEPKESKIEASAETNKTEVPKSEETEPIEVLGVEQETTLPISKEADNLSKDNPPVINIEEFATMKADLETFKKKYNQSQQVENLLRNESQSIELQLQNVSRERSELKSKNVQFEAKIAELTATIEAQKANVEFAEKYLNEKRKTLKEMYFKKNNGTANPQIEKIIDKSDSEELEGLFSEFGQGLYEFFTPTCKSCGSKEFSFKTSDMKPLEDGKGNVEEPRLTLTDKNL